jgi:quinol-cytochrome oxidoreductase complex cytochrome b subunit
VPFNPEAVFMQEIITIPMISGVNWTMTLGDLMVAIILILLFVELIKATRTTAISIVDHALSMVVFIICVVEFIVVDVAATSVFFILTLVTLIDVIAGFSITIKAARRDLALGEGM